jgi:hypothetical protein
MGRAHGSSRGEPPRHRDAEKKQRREDKKEISKEARKPGKEKTDRSLFLASWVP